MARRHSASSPPALRERLGGRAAAMQLELVELPLGTRDQLIQIDTSQVRSLRLDLLERAPQRELAPHPQQKRLELHQPAQRGVPEQPPVQLQPPELLRP